MLNIKELKQNAKEYFFNSADFVILVFFDTVGFVAISYFLFLLRVWVQHLSSKSIDIAIPFLPGLSGNDLTVLINFAGEGIVLLAYVVRLSLRFYRKFKMD